MSHFLDRLTYFSQPRESFSDGHGQVTNEDRSWEDAYRKRWQHDKIVRSTQLRSSFVTWPWPSLKDSRGWEK